MYCIKCGAEIRDGSKFCIHCGAKQDVPNAAPVAGQVYETPTFIKDGVDIIKNFFSKSPFGAVEAAARSKSLAWIVFIVLNIILFGVAGFVNFTQIMNRLVKSMVSIFTSSFGRFGSLVSDYAKVPFFPRLFWWYALIAIIVLALEFGGLYIIAIISKSRTGSVMNILNVLAAASIPITLGAVLNMLVGLVLPSLIICVTITVAVLHIILLYRGLCCVANFRTAPVWSFSLLILVISLIFVFIFGLALGYAFNQAVTSTVPNNISRLF